MNQELSLIFKALDFAARKHRDQRRKDELATPYINHPIEVTELLINEGNIADINVLVAAILHDTVEDTETTVEELEAVFGVDIAAIVAEVTDDKALPKAERKRLQIENAGRCSRQAKLVKIADKTCNLRDMLINPPAGWELEWIRNYFDWAGQVIDQLRGVNPVLEKLFDMEYAKKP
jgi:guanosine-3',5'-bis(diphosphate) 3'-pyrophosphohydrolase